MGEMKERQRWWERSYVHRVASESLDESLPPEGSSLTYVEQTLEPRPLHSSSTLSSHFLPVLTSLLLDLVLV